LTNVVEESQGVALAEYLTGKGARVVVYDPQAMENARRRLGEKVEYASSLADCTSQAQVLAIVTPWDEFKKLQPEDLNRASACTTVFDCWRILPREEFEAVVEYRTLGLGPRVEGGREPVPAAFNAVRGKV
jgi:UDPglucose 6-dehydrogenase